MPENNRAIKNGGKHGKTKAEPEEHCNRAQRLITSYLDDIRYQQGEPPESMTSKWKLSPAKPMSLDQKALFVRHIRSCRECREDLGFCLAIYVNTEVIDDADIPNDYGKAVEQLLEETENEIARAQHRARTGRFRLIAILLILALALSLSVGRSTIEPEPEEISVRTSGFYLGDLGLPEEIAFTDNFIAAHHDGARDFVFSQALRAAEVEKLWRSDVELMRAMYPDSELTYILPSSFLRAEGSYARRLETGKRPEIVYQVSLTLKPFPHPKKDNYAPKAAQK